MTQVINVSENGAEFTDVITIFRDDGADISAAAVQIRLRAADGTGEWTDGVQTRPKLSAVTVSMIVDESVPPGVYWVETKVSRGPEEVIRQWFRVKVA